MMCYLQRKPRYAYHDDGSIATTPLAAISWLQRPLACWLYLTDHLFSYSPASITHLAPEITAAPHRHGFAQRCRT